MPDEIVVTGGSVTVDLRDNLQPQTNAPTGMRRYSGAGRLTSIQINEDKPIEVDGGATIRITYDTA